MIRGVIPLPALGILNETGVLVKEVLDLLHRLRVSVRDDDLLGQFVGVVVASRQNRRMKKSPSRIITGRGNAIILY